MLWIDQITVDTMIVNHQEWLEQRRKGEKGDDNLRADFSYTGLMNLLIYDADLTGANFTQANICNVKFKNCNLTDCIFLESIICQTEFCNCDFTNVNFDGHIFECDFRDSRIPKDSLLYCKTCVAPTKGSFIGWKTCGPYIIKLLIPEDAKRSNAGSRKCRCSKAMVLDIQTLDGRSANICSYDHHSFGIHTIYKKGEMVYPDSFDENRWNECSHGIHFFITREEAVTYGSGSCRLFYHMYNAMQGDQSLWIF